MDPAKAAQIIVNGMEKNNYHSLADSDSTFMDLVYRLNSQFATI